MSSPAAAVLAPMLPAPPALPPAAAAAVPWRLSREYRRSVTGPPLPARCRPGGAGGSEGPAPAPAAKRCWNAASETGDPAAAGSSSPAARQASGHPETGRLAQLELRGRARRGEDTTQGVLATASSRSPLGQPLESRLDGPAHLLCQQHHLHEDLVGQATLLEASGGDRLFIRPAVHKGRKPCLRRRGGHGGQWGRCSAQGALGRAGGAAALKPRRRAPGRRKSGRRRREEGGLVLEGQGGHEVRTRQKGLLLAGACTDGRGGPFESSESRTPFPFASACRRAGWSGRMIGRRSGAARDAWALRRRRPPRPPERRAKGTSPGSDWTLGSLRIAAESLSFRLPDSGNLRSPRTLVRASRLLLRPLEQGCRGSGLDRRVLRRLAGVVRAASKVAKVLHRHPALERHAMGHPCHR